MDEKKENGRKAESDIKSRIYQSADQLFREYGLEKVSVDAIVKKAGISKGAFYLYFDSKDTLLAAFITQYVNKADLDYKLFLESVPDHAASSDTLLSLVDMIADNIACGIGYSLIKIAYRIQIERTISTDMLLNYNRELYRTISRLIDRGIQRGEFRTAFSAESIADHFVTVLRGYTYEWCIRYPDFDLKAMLHKQFEILLSGIKKQ